MDKESNILNLPFKGKSMEGLIKEGDTISIELYDSPQNINLSHLGKVVLIKDDHEWVTHRVVKVDDELVTKGDYSLQVDSPNAQDIWGEVKSVQTDNGTFAWPLANKALSTCFAHLSLGHQMTKARPLRVICRKIMCGLGRACRFLFVRPLENQSFLALLRGNRPLLDPSDYIAVKTLAQRHMMTSYLYNRLHPKNLDDFKEWREKRKKDRFNAMIVLHELNTLIQATPENLRPCLLKGASLIKRIYKDMGERPMTDIDLLLKKDEKVIIEDILINNDFHRMTEDHGPANRCKSTWIKPQFGTDVVIEIHLKLNWFQPNGFQWNFCDSQISGYKQLDMVDEVIYLCIHLSYSHNFQRLFWLMDIYELLKKYEAAMDWEHFAIRAKELKAEKAIASVLYGLEIIFKFRLKTWPLPKSYSYLLFFINKSFLLNPYGSIVRFLVNKHVLQDRLLNAFKYDFYRIMISINHRIGRKHINTRPL